MSDRAMCFFSVVAQDDRKDNTWVKVTRVPVVPVEHAATIEFGRHQITIHASVEQLSDIAAKLSQALLDLAVRNEESAIGLTDNQEPVIIK